MRAIWSGGLHGREARGRDGPERHDLAALHGNGGALGADAHARQAGEAQAKVVLLEEVLSDGVVLAVLGLELGLVGSARREALEGLELVGGAMSDANADVLEAQTQLALVLLGERGEGGGATGATRAARAAATAKVTAAAATTATTAASAASSAATAVEATGAADAK